MINPELQVFLSHWSAAWARLPAGAGPKQRREHFELVAREMRTPMPDSVETEERWIAVPGSGRQVRVRLFRHRDAGAAACLIYMHGGAWMQGSPETHWDICAAIADANRQAVISVDYALAPEHPFPAAANDCRAVVEWTFDNAAALRMDTTAIAVGGDSAGGNLAAVQTLIFRGTERRLAAQLLVYPGVDFRLDRPSHVENAEGPIITVAGMAQVDAMYCPDPGDRTNPLAAPLLAESHAGLPRAFIGVAEHDPLRDGGIAYADALRKAGVSVELDRGPGLTHSYLRSLAYCADARRTFERMCAWLRSAPA